MSTEHTSSLSLRNRSISELRDLSKGFLIKTDTSDWDRNLLIAALSEEASKNERLGRVLQKYEIAIKPSFYLMILAPRGQLNISEQNLAENLRIQLSKINKKIEEPTATTKAFNLEYCSVTADDVIEIQFSWQKIIWYWAPVNVALEHVYGLQFGFALLDLRANKALIACHTQRERDVLARSMREVLPVDLSPLVLTKPLLNQIGDVSKLKRATYVHYVPDPDIPANLTYADEDLGSIPLVLAEEGSSRSSREQSFYRIPLGGAEEKGVGVTSSSGKLWIPQDTPLSTVREYGGQLLGRIGSTLVKMSKEGEIDKLLEVMGLPRLPSIVEIKPIALRRAICDLASALINMLLAKEQERPFRTPSTFATRGVDKYFQAPRLRLVDPETGEVGYWRSSDGASEIVRLSREGGTYRVVSVPSGEEVDTARIRHPLSGREVEIQDPIAALELFPSPLLQRVIRETIHHIRSHEEKLKGVLSTPFLISANKIKLDIQRAFGQASPDDLQTELALSDLREFRRATSFDLPVDDRLIRKRLRSLGEKCKHMSDDNCSSCVRKSMYLCLRSLVARQFIGAHLLLAHKGIERSDLQMRGTINDHEVRFLGFAKKSGGMTGLTARNDAGASLLAQVLSQVDKSDFQAVAVISSDTINEDLRERIILLCSVFRKKVLFLDFEQMGKLLLDFEEQAAFDQIDVSRIYEASAQEQRDPGTLGNKKRRKTISAVTSATP